MHIRLSKRRVSAFILAAALYATSASAEIKFIGEGTIPGTATDQSGLSGLLEDGVTPRNRVGGLGSALAYTGIGQKLDRASNGVNEILAVNDHEFLVIER